ncbi:hypothetical protein EV363DRAFT_1398455 [Boletus edulis]|nr:hypothetical protein EV363DRAFT_1398455 [Boletus edulis]
MPGLWTKQIPCKHDSKHTTCVCPLMQACFRTVNVMFRLTNVVPICGPSSIGRCCGSHGVTRRMPYPLTSISELDLFPLSQGDTLKRRWHQWEIGSNLIRGVGRVASISEALRKETSTCERCGAYKDTSARPK